MYGIIHKSIFDSTIVLHGKDALLVFMAMITLADENHVCDFGRHALARRIGITLEELDEAIKRLSTPDPDSSSQEFDGRRVVALKDMPEVESNRGWFIVNREKYIKEASAEYRRKRTRDRVTRHREKIKDLKESSVTDDEKKRTCNDNINVNININKKKKNTCRADARRMRVEAKELLDFLNQKTGKNYRHVDANIKMIMDRLKEGYTAVEIRQVIANRFLKWKDNDRMRDYLRPKTLFNKTNMANYIGELTSE